MSHGIVCISSDGVIQKSNHAPEDILHGVSQAELSSCVPRHDDANTRRKQAHARCADDLINQSVLDHRAVAALALAQSSSPLLRQDLIASGASVDERAATPFSASDTPSSIATETAALRVSFPESHGKTTLSESRGCTVVLIGHWLRLPETETEGR